MRTLFSKIVEISPSGEMKIYKEYAGLSSETPPTDCCTGSKLLFVDTGDVKCFDEDNSTWYTELNLQE